LYHGQGKIKHRTDWSQLVVVVIVAAVVDVAVVFVAAVDHVVVPAVAAVVGHASKTRM
jgi:hypothetical protein